MASYRKYGFGFSVGFVLSSLLINKWNGKRGKVQQQYRWPLKSSNCLLEALGKAVKTSPTDQRSAQRHLCLHLANEENTKGNSFATLNTYLHDLLKAEVELSAKWSKEELKDIRNAVGEMIVAIAEEVYKTDEISKFVVEKQVNKAKDNQKRPSRKHAHSIPLESTIQNVFEILPVGSSVDGTKVVNPDEYDFLFVFKIINLLPCLRPEKDNNFSYFSLEDPEENDKLITLLKEEEVLIPAGKRLYLSSGGFYSYAIKCFQHAYDCLVGTKNAVIKKETGSLKMHVMIGIKDKVKQRNIEEDIRTTLYRNGIGMNKIELFYRRNFIREHNNNLEHMFPRPVTVHGPAAQLSFYWISKAASETTQLRVTVDLVPAVAIPKDENETQNHLPWSAGQLNCNTDVYFVTFKEAAINTQWQFPSFMPPLDDLRYSDYSPVLGKHKHAFVISCSDQEIPLIRDIEGAKVTVFRCHKLLKYLINETFICNCGTCTQRFVLGHYIDTYMIKTLVMKHVSDESNCCHQTTAHCLINILENAAMVFRKKDIRITNLWNKNNNLCTYKCDLQDNYTRYVVHMHLIFLLEQLHIINEDKLYSFKKYKNIQFTHDHARKAFFILSLWSLI